MHSVNIVSQAQKVMVFWIKDCNDLGTLTPKFCTTAT